MHDGAVYSHPRVVEHYRLRFSGKKDENLHRYTESTINISHDFPGQSQDKILPESLKIDTVKDGSELCLVLPT